MTADRKNAQIEEILAEFRRDELTWDEAHDALNSSGLPWRGCDYVLGAIQAEKEKEDE